MQFNLNAGIYFLPEKDYGFYPEGLSVEEMRNRENPKWPIMIQECVQTVKNSNLDFICIAKVTRQTVLKFKQEFNDQDEYAWIYTDTNARRTFDRHSNRDIIVHLIGYRKKRFQPLGRKSYRNVFCCDFNDGVTQKVIRVACGCLSDTKTFDDDNVTPKHLLNYLEEDIQQEVAARIVAGELFFYHRKRSFEDILWDLDNNVDRNKIPRCLIKELRTRGYDFDRDTTPTFGGGLEYLGRSRWLYCQSPNPSILNKMSIDQKVGVFEGLLFGTEIKNLTLKEPSDSPLEQDEQSPVVEQNSVNNQKPNVDEEKFG